MEANKILNADFLDILFEGKNKQYGAYDLRKTYNSRMIKAMIATGALLLLLFVGSLLAKAMESSAKDDLNVKDVEMAEVKKDDAPPPPPPPPPPPTPPPPPEVNQIKFTPPVIVKDNEVKPDEKIQEIKEDAAISSKTVETDNKTQVVQAPIEEKSSGIVEAPAKPVEEDKIFTKVEIEAGYPGGSAAFKRFLEKNLNGQVATDNNAPSGAYTVIVKFIVDKNGAISDVQAETSNGYGMEEEAVRVIKKSINWTPAMQNGNVVKAYRRQPIVFQVAE